MQILSNRLCYMVLQFGAISYKFEVLTENTQELTKDYSDSSYSWISHGFVRYSHDFG